jgi:hypothetical protein
MRQEMLLWLAVEQPLAQLLPSPTTTTLASPVPAQITSISGYTMAQP